MLIRKVYILIPLVLLVHILCTQILLAQHTKADSILIFSYINKAEQFYTADNYDSALLYCNKAIEQSQQKKFTYGKAYSLIKKTDILIQRQDYKNTYEFSLLVEKFGYSLKDSLIMAIANLLKAQIKMYNNDLDSAILFFQKSFKLKFDKANSNYAALAYNDYGYLFGLKADYQKNADNVLKALSIYEKLGNNDGAAMTLGNLASMYYSLGDKEKALEYQKKNIAKRSETDIEGLTISYCNISQMYMQMGDIKQAEYYQQLCLKYSQQSNIPSKKVLGYLTAGLLANAKGDNASSYVLEKKVIDILEKSHTNDIMLSKRYIAAAIAAGNNNEDSLITLLYFKKAMDLSKQLNIREHIKLSYLYQTIFYKKHGDYYNAYENYKKYIVYNDSINSEETKRTIADLDKKYQTKKKDNEIISLNTQQKIKQLQIEKQKAIIAGNVLEATQKQNEILVLSQQKELQDATLKQQSESLEKQLLISKNNQQQLKLSQQEKQLKEKELQAQKQLRNFIIGSGVTLLLLGGFIFNRYQLKKKLQQQNELLHMRNNIAQDLHDEIGSTLTSIKILSQVSKNNLTKDKKKSSTLLSQITEQSEQMQQGMSDIVWAIKPDNDKLQNILLRMKEYTNQVLEPKNIFTTFTVDEKLLNENLDMQQRRDLFLIFKEAINNAAKYSDAAEVKIILNKQNGNIILQIQDNGKGFNQTILSTSNGIKNIKTRAEALGGSAIIKSAINNGTTITVKIPAT